MSPEELAEKGAFSRDDLKRFQKSEDFLWAVRCHLHFIAKRGEDKLSFDRQGELAERLGYKSHGGLKHVERSFAAAAETAERLDHAALAEGRAITIPLVRRVLG